MDIAQFRTDFPEFTDPIKYTDSQITFWSDLGEQLLSLERFGTLWNFAVELFTAHNISLAYRNVHGQPGQSGFMKESKTVGSVNTKAEVNNTMYKGWGQLNLTTYGIQLIGLIKMFGAGGVQL